MRPFLLLRLVALHFRIFFGKNDDQLILLLAECFYKDLPGNFSMQPRGELFDEMIILMHFLIGLYSGKCREEWRKEEICAPFAHLRLLLESFLQNREQRIAKRLLSCITLLSYKMEQATKLNSMQLFMIRLFEKQLNARQEEEIKKLLTDYFAKQIDDEMDQIWEEKGLSQEHLNEALEQHKRTHY